MSQTMPAKMISEMPLPMPRSVICSPSHMMNAVPVVSEIIVIDVEVPAWDRAPPRRTGAYWVLLAISQLAMKNDWTSARTMQP